MVISGLFMLHTLTVFTFLCNVGMHHWLEENLLRGHSNHLHIIPRQPPVQTASTRGAAEQNISQNGKNTSGDALTQQPPRFPWRSQYIGFFLFISRPELHFRKSRQRLEESSSPEGYSGLGKKARRLEVEGTFVNMR